MMLRRALFLSLLSIAAPAFADETAKLARDLVAKSANAVVTVRLVVKQEIALGGDSSESNDTHEITGTIVQPDGLTVTALSSTDSTQEIKEMVAAMMQQQEGAVQIQSTIAHVELIAEDGKSTPAAVVLRDKDLDLAFIRPLEKRAEPWPFVALKKDAAIEAFDEVIIPYRLGRVAGRLCTATIVRALGALQKPRKLYVLGDWVAQEMGGAAFNLAGEAAGIVVLRRIKDASTPPAMPMANEADPNVSAVVVPAAAVLDSAAQAPQSVPAAPAPAAAEPDENTVTIQPGAASEKSNSDAVVLPSSAAEAPKP